MTDLELGAVVQCLGLKWTKARRHHQHDGHEEAPEPVHEAHTSTRRRHQRHLKTDPRDRNVVAATDASGQALPQSSAAYRPRFLFSYNTVQKTKLRGVTCETPSEVS